MSERDGVFITGSVADYIRGGPPDPPPTPKPGFCVDCGEQSGVNDDWRCPACADKGAEAMLAAADAVEFPRPTVAELNARGWKSEVPPPVYPTDESGRPMDPMHYVEEYDEWPWGPW